MSAPSLSQQHTAPNRDITIDLAIAVARLRYLGVAVRHNSTMDKVADWHEPTQTIYLRASATIWAKLWVLGDLLALFTNPSHVSPSSPTAPYLTLVQNDQQNPTQRHIANPREPHTHGAT